MKRFGFSSVALLSVLAFAAAPASAQSSLTFNNTLVAGGVTYNYFTVTNAGTFDIWTTSSTGPAGVTPFDPQMYLFAGFGTGGSLLFTDDDACFFADIAQCGSAAFGANSLLNNIFLAVGNYTVAVGGFPLLETEARSGVNEGSTYEGAYNLRVASLGEFGGGDGVAVPAEVVPEPATMTLLATGLAGMAAARRKKRNA